MVLAERKHFDEAIVEYWKSMEHRPFDPESHYNLALALVELGQIDKAIPEYERALQLRPDYAETHNNLGNREKKGRFEEAIAHYERALQIKPDYAGTTTTWASRWWGKAESRKTRLPIFKRPWNSNPSSPSARRSLTRALADQEKKHE